LYLGPPIWLSEAEQCVYEPLGTGETLKQPTEITLSDDSDTQIIGEWGELLVHNYLQKLKVSVCLVSDCFFFLLSRTQNARQNDINGVQVKSGQMWVDELLCC
jgi:hypothetical protein